MISILSMEWCGIIKGIYHLLKNMIIWFFSNVKEANSIKQNHIGVYLQELMNFSCKWTT